MDEGFMMDEDFLKKIMEEEEEEEFKYGVLIDIKTKHHPTVLCVLLPGNTYRTLMATVQVWTQCIEKAVGGRENMEFIHYTIGDFDAVNEMLDWSVAEAKMKSGVFHCSRSWTDIHFGVNEPPTEYSKLVKLLEKPAPAPPQKGALEHLAERSQRLGV